MKIGHFRKLWKTILSYCYPGVSRASACSDMVQSLVPEDETSWPDANNPV
jgi:hypothetical protein